MLTFAYMKKFLLILILMTIATYGMSQGCSQCRMMADQSTEVSANDFGRNINTGILFLIAIPYCILMFLFRKQLLRLVKRILPSKS